MKETRLFFKFPECHVHHRLKQIGCVFKSIGTRWNVAVVRQAMPWCEKASKLRLPGTNPPTDAEDDGGMSERWEGTNERMFSICRVRQAEELLPDDDVMGLFVLQEKPAVSSKVYNSHCIAQTITRFNTFEWQNGLVLLRTQLCVAGCSVKTVSSIP